MKEIEKNYDSNIMDLEAIKTWEEQDFFEPEKYEKLMNSKGKPVNKPFVMTLPPPNANGDLHLGHMIGYSFQDCMGRYNRLKSRPVLLLPGKDHAGIQTEAVYTKMLEEKGKNKWDIGREEFYKGCYDFCIEKSVNARTQEKRIGLSADWNREKFTLDPRLTEVIYDTFAKMVEDGLVYRGKYIINQCPHCRTALADVDTEHKDMRGILAQIVYPFTDHSDEKIAEKEWGSNKKFLYNEQEIIMPPSTKGITVATTRPETMLGDTAVAVHPDDPRYKKFIGKKVLLPFMNKEIEIIADEDLDPIFGTGALKVTPAHSPIDFKIGKKHGLDIVNVIDEEGKMCSPAPDKFIGMNGIDCSKALCAELKEQDLLLKIENIKHEVTVCERCNTPIEPIISKQWFVNAKPLADEVLKRLKNGECKVVPAGQQKALEFFLSNIEPWCISRQLWWGHRIPVWYSGGKKLYDTLLDLYEKEKGSELRPGEYDKLPQNEIDKLISKYKIEVKGSGRIVASANKPDDEGNWEQEIDVFDTWFSSGQWPFSTLGGPDGDDFKKYYPTDVLETMRDILYLWVSRMMMLGTYRTGKMPFHTVYLHGMVLAPDGTKMSKSKGNGVEPKEIIDKYGADALRLWYLNDTMAGGNSPIREENIKAHRNFVNKIWNAFRFVLTNIEDSEFEAINEKIGFIGKDFISLVDFDLLRKSFKISKDWESRVVETEASISKVEKNISRYRFNLASMEMREFFWHTVCDKWIEEVKLAVKDSEIGAENRIEQFSLLIAVMIAYLKMMHPFIPFVTEIVMGILSRH